MIKLFELLIYGCWHKWEFVNNHYKYDSNFPVDGGLPQSVYAVCKCEKCGIFRSFKK